MLNDSLYELHKPVAGDPEMDLVFFHGLQWGDYREACLTTWRSSGESGCWLNTWLVDEFPKARVLSVSYDSSANACSIGQANIDSIGESLAVSVIEKAKVGQGRPVVLVGHSLGGLVMKEVCLQAHRMHYADPSRIALAAFLENLRGAFFFATPNSGPVDAKIVSTFGTGPLLNYLKVINKHATRLNAEFSMLRKIRGWRTCGAGEAIKTNVLGVFDSMVVHEESAKKDMDVFDVIQGANHTSLCRPEERNSSAYLNVVNFIRRFLEEAKDSQLPATHSTQNAEALRSVPQLSERPFPQLPAGVRLRVPRAVPKLKARDWTLVEMKKLIAAKRQESEYITSGNSLQKKIAAGKEKWKWIAQYILQKGVTDPIRDPGSCKKKWEKLIGDWKRVCDFEKNVPAGHLSYYKMTISERKRVGLPINFPEEIYRDIEDWFPTRHDIDPSGISIMDSSAINRDRPISAHFTLVDGGSDDQVEAAAEAEEVEEEPVEEEDVDLPSPGPSHPSAPSEGASDATPSTDGSKGKRKRSSGTNRDGEENSIHTSTAQLLEILKDDSVRRNLHNEAELALHRETVAMHREIVAMQREVGLANAASLQANATSIQRVADALLQLVATKFKNSDEST